MAKTTADTSMNAAKAWLRQRIPAIATRDRIIADERAATRSLRQDLERSRGEVADLTAQLDIARTAQERLRRRSTGEPSFVDLLSALRQQATVSVQRDGSAETPLMQIPYKLRNYRLASSHGVAVPDVLAAWTTIEDISGLAELPDRFVLKSDGGAGSSGVFLLERTDQGRYRLIGTERSVTEAELKGEIASFSPRRVRPPFFIEGYLPTARGESVIPEDVKIYASHGRILQVMLRRVGKHGAPSTIRTRFLNERGEDLGDVALDHSVDASIPIPQWLPEMIAATKHLSRAVGVPFCRVDLYDGVDGPILGEITRAPGGSQHYREHHDRWMGEQWLRGMVDLNRDLAHGRPHGVLHGDQPAANLYPAGHVSQSASPGPWETRVVPCGQWC